MCLFPSPIVAPKLALFVIDILPTVLTFLSSKADRENLDRGKQRQTNSTDSAPPVSRRVGQPAGGGGSELFPSLVVGVRLHLLTRDLFFFETRFHDDESENQIS